MDPGAFSRLREVDLLREGPRDVRRGEKPQAHLQTTDLDAEKTVARLQLPFTEHFTVSGTVLRT